VNSFGAGGIRTQRKLYSYVSPVPTYYVVVRLVLLNAEGIDFLN